MKSSLRCITVDATGTLLAYKGHLGDYYCMAAKAIGLPCPDYDRMHEGFKKAYKKASKRFPCFGRNHSIHEKEWWRFCVRDSFIEAGYHYDNATADKVFDRIYAAFGSTAPYTVFPDVNPFLHWARSKGLVVGIISNSEIRYRDVILPALEIRQGFEWDFGVFSGVDGIEKPDPLIFKLALQRAGNVPAASALHIGDSLGKDYLPAKGVGMQAFLLDRFQTQEAKSWKEQGIPVFQDLLAIKEWIIQNQILDDNHDSISFACSADTKAWSLG